VLGIAGLLVGGCRGHRQHLPSETELLKNAGRSIAVWRPLRKESSRLQGTTWKRRSKSLNEVLYKVRVKGDVKQGISRIEIERIGLTKGSKMTCFVNVSGDLTMMNGVRIPLRDDQKDCAIESAPESSRAL